MWEDQSSRASRAALARGTWLRPNLRAVWTHSRTEKHARTPQESGRKHFQTDKSDQFSSISKLEVADLALWNEYFVPTETVKQSDRLKEKVTSFRFLLTNPPVKKKKKIPKGSE